MPSNVGRSGMFAIVHSGYGITAGEIRGEWSPAAVPRRVTAVSRSQGETPRGDRDMALPTRAELIDETDRRYFLRYPNGPRVIDPDDASHDPYEAAWLQIRDEVLWYWTDAAFKKFFPTAGQLQDGDGVLVEYWNDIKNQILG